MIDRRAILTGTIVAGALFAAPALACRAPAPKNRDGYSAAIDRLFKAWWARDFAAFQQPFQRPKRQEPFDTRPIFDAHFAKPAKRFRGELLFNGATVVAQVVTPQDGDPAAGVCSGFATADLFVVRFFPGLADAVIQDVRYVDFDLLASAEWTSMPGQ